MLLRSYKKEISRSVCDAKSKSLQCIARLVDDITEVLPYLNVALGGYRYTREPPSLTLHIYDRVVVVYPDQIAINEVADETDADQMLEWLIHQINTVWERRKEIEPRVEDTPRPQIVEILRRLPKTNCNECGQPSCMVFAKLLAEGAVQLEACPVLSEEEQERLTAYLDQFQHRSVVFAGERHEVSLAPTSVMPDSTAP